jgi:subtilisin-like proprotein convertase family protein
LSGTASNGLDYVTLPGAVTIPPGASTATITITPIDDQLVEGSETVIATIASSNTYLVGSPAGATITIADNDTSPSLSITSVVFSVVVGNGNAAIDPGETVQETIVLRNSGTLPATAVSGTLSTTNAGVTITQPTSAYPTVPGSGGTATNSTPFQYRLAKTVTCGSTLTFTHVAVSGGLSFTNNFSRFVSQLVTALNTNTFASTGVPKTVPDKTTVYSTNTVSLAATNIITDVNVSLRMNETADGDLVIAIQHPDGTESVLSTNRGGSGDNFGTGICGSNEVRTVFDDEAATAISAGTAPFAGSFRPDGVLSNFDGKTLNGNWRLRITDIAGASSGTLTCWSLSVISSQQVLNCSVFNNPPVASNQAVSVTMNTATVLTLKGSDVDGDPITFRTNSLPAHGTLSDFNTLTGAITYTPAAGYIGPDSFTCSVNDGSTNSASATVSITVMSADSVGDGILDTWRAQYFGGSGSTTNSQSCALCDPDGDGVNNFAEYLSGTNPTNSASFFGITAITKESNDVRLTWMAGSGRTNTLERSTGAAGSYFNNFATIFTVTNTVGTTTNFLDVGAATNFPARYYRVRLVP